MSKSKEVKKVLKHYVIPDSVDEVVKKIMAIFEQPEKPEKLAVVSEKKEDKSAEDKKEKKEDKDRPQVKTTPVVKQPTDKKKKHSAVVAVPDGQHVRTMVTDPRDHGDIDKQRCEWTQQNEDVVVGTPVDEEEE